MKTLNAFRLAAASVLALGVVNAQAATDTSTIAVTATVVENCMITTNTDLAFGAYDFLGANATADATTTGQVEIICNNGSQGVLSLDSGLNAVAAGQQAMESTTLPGTYLTYTVSDTLGGTSWIDVAVTGDGTAQTFDVYGTIPAAQNAPVGSYADTVTATITY